MIMPGPTFEVWVKYINLFCPSIIFPYACDWAALILPVFLFFIFVDKTNLICLHIWWALFDKNCFYDIHVKTRLKISYINTTKPKAVKISVSKLIFFYCHWTAINTYDPYIPVKINPVIYLYVVFFILFTSLLKGGRDKIKNWRPHEMYTILLKTPKRRPRITRNRHRLVYFLIIANTVPSVLYTMVVRWDFTKIT